MPDLVYCDSCVFIELIQKGDKKRLDACESLIARAEKEEIVLVTSNYTIIEVNKCDGKLPEKDYQLITDLFEHKYIARRALDRYTSELARDLVRAHGLSNADSVHVATAIKNGVSVMYTYDGCKEKRKGLLSKNLKIGAPPLKIEIPPDPGKGTLFSEALVEANQADANILPIESGKKVG